MIRFILIWFIIISGATALHWLFLTLAPMGSVAIIPIGIGKELDINFWPQRWGLRVVVWYQDVLRTYPIVRGTVPLGVVMVVPGIILTVLGMWVRVRR